MFCQKCLLSLRDNNINNARITAAVNSHLMHVLKWFQMHRILDETDVTTLKFANLKLEIWHAWNEIPHFMELQNKVGEPACLYAVLIYLMIVCWRICCYCQLLLLDNG